MARIRGILIDNTFSKMFSNIDATVNATAQQLIAGSIARAAYTSIKQPGYPISVVTSIQPAQYFPNPGIITSASYSFRAQYSSQSALQAIIPQGRDVWVVLRKVSSAGATANLGQFILSKGTSTGTINTGTIVISTGDTIYWDVTQVGTTQPGQGLLITTNYYSGY